MKKLLAALLVAGTLSVVAAPAAQAAGWDVIADRSGYGTVTLRTWTRGYNLVNFRADHAGSNVTVYVVSRCANGDSFEQSWTDGGARFTFTLGGMRNDGRCNHTFRVVGNGVQLYLVEFAR